MEPAEYMEARADSATTYILPYTRPLMTRTPHGDPEPVGSCVLLWHRGQRYLVSAAHVFDVFLDSPLLLGTDSKWQPLNGQFRCTDPPAGRPRKDDRLDFGFLPVSDADASALDGCLFLQANQVLTGEHITFQPPSRPKYMAVGYPLNRFNYDRRKNSTTPEIGRIMGAIAQLDRFDRHKRRPETHLLLELEFKGAHSRKGPVGKLPKLEGLSGGPIVSLPGVTRLGDASPPQLVGVTTEYWAADDLFVGVRIGVVLRIIDAAV